MVLELSDLADLPPTITIKETTMARTLTETERGLVSAALAQHAGNLRSADATGVAEIDSLVADRANSADELATLYAASTRASVSVRGEED